MWRSPPGWIARTGWSRSGEDGSGPRGWRGWMRSLGLGGRGRFPPTEIAEVKALACELPATSGRPLSRWSAAELAREAVTRGIMCSVSGTTVWRWLAEEAIRPWAWRSWVFPRDPAFREKAGRVLDLYERRWEGRRLHPGEYVISADEKTQLQALLRRHPLVAPAPGRPGLVDHEYRRRGTLAYLAAMDVHDPQRGLFGQVRPKISNQAFDELVAEVMSTEPYTSAKRVFLVVDNGTIHRGQAAIDRLLAFLQAHRRFPGAARRGKRRRGGVSARPQGRHRDAGGLCAGGRRRSEAGAPAITHGGRVRRRTSCRARERARLGMSQPGAPSIGRAAQSWLARRIGSV